MTSNLFGVTGVTGGIGGRVALRLSRAGAAQRLIVRDRSQAPELPAAEVAEAVDYGHSESFRDACRGVETLFLVSGREHPERLRKHVTAVDAALAAGVKRIVYLSFLGASPDATFTLARQHHATEEHIRRAGVPFTFLRNSLYLDYLGYLAGPDGVIAGPAGNGRVAPVAREDVSDVVAAVLLSGRHDGQTYDNTGDRAVTVQEVAGELARASGRPVEYRNQTVDEAWESRRSSGAPDWEIEGWVTSYLAIAAGELDVVSDTVSRVAGHPPMSLPEFLDGHPDSYAHLLPD